MRLTEDQPQPLAFQPRDRRVRLVESGGDQQGVVRPLLVRVHGPRVTDVQMRARCGSIKPDLTTSAPEATPINALACRTEAGVGGSPTAA